MRQADWNLFPKLVFLNSTYNSSENSWRGVQSVTSFYFEKKICCITRFVGECIPLAKAGKAQYQPTHDFISIIG